MAVPGTSRRNRDRRVWLSTLCVAAFGSWAHADTAAVAKEVAKQRELPLKKAIDEEVVERAELRTRIQRLASDPKTQAEVRAEGLALARWGLVPIGLDYLQLEVDLLGEQIAGY